MPKRKTDPPELRTEKEEAEFWSTHDMLDVELEQG